MNYLHVLLMIKLNDAIIKYVKFIRNITICLTATVIFR